MSAGSGSDLWRRFKTALVVGPPILFAVYLGVWPFTAVVVLFGSLIFVEWDRLSRKIESDLATWVGVAGIAVAGVATAMGQILVAIAAVVLAFIVMCVLRPKARNRAWMGFGLIYAAAPVISLVVLRALPGDGIMPVGWALTTVWATDIGAYAFGRTFGGPKLWPRISPKKTWAGFFGGLIGAVVWSAGIWLVFGFSWALGVVIPALVVSLVGQGGDMFESWVKRHFGVKDSGGIFPGHGGVLDRADSVIPAVTVVALLNTFGLIFVALSG